MTWGCVVVVYASVDDTLYFDVVVFTAALVVTEIGVVAFGNGVTDFVGESEAVLITEAGVVSGFVAFVSVVVEAVVVDFVVVSVSHQQKQARRLTT